MSRQYRSYKRGGGTHNKQAFVVRQVLFIVVRTLLPSVTMGSMSDKVKTSEKLNYLQKCTTKPFGNYSQLRHLAAAEYVLTSGHLNCLKVAVNNVVVST